MTDTALVKKKTREKGRYTNNSKYREYFKAYCKMNQRKKRLELLLLAGGVECKRCGFNDQRALQIDHIDGGGIKEKHITNNVYSFIKQVGLYPKKYQVLCANCNWIKRYENDESGLRFKNKKTNK